MRRFVLSALVGVRRRAALRAVTCPQRPVRRAIPWRAPCGRTGARPAPCARLPASRPREPHHEAPRLARHHRYRQPVRLPHGTCERHEARVVVAPAGNLPRRPVAPDRLRRLRKLVTHVIPVPHRASPLLRQRPRRVSGPSPRLGKPAAENRSKRRTGDAVAASVEHGARARESRRCTRRRLSRPVRWRRGRQRGGRPRRRARTRAMRILAFLACLAEHDATLPHCRSRTARASTRKAPVDGADAEDGAPAQDGAPAPG
jgi:hypothetical protein